ERGQTMSVIFLAGFSVPTRLWISETKIILAHRKLQINATFPPELANSALQNWFIVASTSVGTVFSRMEKVPARMSRSGHQIGA
ncbi:MAG TPA: hypothetical protein VJS86_14820, partial [Arthrobacter sp.]|nr:hypothetical protein [Arthrobacter sp.]